MLAVRSTLVVAALTLYSLPGHAAEPNIDKPLIDRIHEAHDRAVNGGRVGDPPLGMGEGETRVGSRGGFNPAGPNGEKQQHPPSQ